MNPMLKWFGGATLALTVVLGGATLANGFVSQQATQNAAGQNIAGQDDLAARLAVNENMPAAQQIQIAQADPADAAFTADANTDAGADFNVAKSDGNTQTLAQLSSTRQNAPANSAAAAPVSRTSAATSTAATPAAQRPVAARRSVPSATPRLQRASAPKDETFVIKRVLPIKGPIRYGEWHWDDKDVPPGPLVVTVDLDARVMSVFRGGYEIGATAVLLGTDKHPTPLGVFPILTKERHNVSEKYDNAPMPWTLRLTWDGIAIHGGNPVENGFASHGCIGTPNGFVSRLYAIAKKGDRVIITRGKRIGMGDKII